MTNFTTRMMIAAATVAVAAGVASAQTLKAEIPFAFRAGNKLMAAGTYTVSTLGRLSGIPMFRIANEDAGVSIIAIPYVASDPQKAWKAAGDPVLAFECLDAHCALTGLWGGRGAPAYTLYRPKLGRDDSAHLATIVMRHDKTD